MSFSKHEFTDYLLEYSFENSDSFFIGLDNIEKLLSTDIDLQYETDKCKGLLKNLNAVAKNPSEISENENTVKQYISQLGIYLKFKESGFDEINSVKTKIKEILNSFKNDFDVVDKNEHYKWEAIAWYKKHWEIEAEKFGEMLKTAFGKAGNLLTSGMYYPYKMLSMYANEFPEEVRELFRMLYDESISLTERYEKFQDSFNRYMKICLKKEENKKYKALQHYQDMHAISVYLFSEYPERYFIYKSRIYEDTRKATGFSEEKTNSNYSVNKYENFAHMCRMILKEIDSDRNLQNLSRARIDENCYKDESYHLLTTDVVYYAARYMDGDKDAPVYWPSLDEYDPGITAEMWIEILNDKAVTNRENLDMLFKMLELGGESTFTYLAEKFGKTHNYYNKLGSSYGEKIKRKYNCPDCIQEEDNVIRNIVYVIPFVGREVNENGSKHYSWKLRDELKEALMSIENPTKQSETDVELNTILYGPPGTGKTYHTVIYAVAVIENKPLEEVKNEDYSAVFERYNQYRADDLIEFTTFHQSYGYEEFIEGIKPVMDSGDDEQSDIKYSIEDGLFKSFCNKSSVPVSKTSANDLGLGKTPTVWKVSLKSTGDNPTRTECLENGHVRIGWDEYGADITEDTDFSENGGKIVLNSFIYKMKIGDIVFSCYSSTTVDAIGVVTGDYEWCGNKYDDGLNRMRKVNWIVKNIREDIVDLNGGSPMTLASVYKLKVSLADAIALIQKHLPPSEKTEEKQNRVFIIDEINRGNISKIFGELITLIESSKRIGKAEGMKVSLPYSKQLFGVPDNVYIIGTMNTADRSIAAIDTALRRRFRFKEMMPDTSVLKDITIEDISISEMLSKINKRISVLFDREHTIGHAYFMPLKDNSTTSQLAEIFKNSIIPLLQEYFYEDYEKIRLVLGDNRKSEDAQFITKKENNYSDLFGDTDFEFDDGCTYEINEEAFTNLESYRSI